MNSGLIKFIVKNIVEHDRELFEANTYDYDKIESRVLKALEDNSLNFNKIEKIILNQNGKKRIVKKYHEKLGNENILCYYIKYILDKIFKMKYPNRNKVMKPLFDIFSAIIQMTEFTIIRFDFENYFNTISSEYVFEKYVKYNIPNRSDIYLINEFVKATKYTYAGLCTSNTLAEIISKHFDNAIFTFAKNYNIIYYERYIDDGIIIINEHVEEDEVKRILNDALISTFFDKSICAKECKTKYNFDKFQYVSRRNIIQNVKPINFLGYEFYLSPMTNGKKIKIEYGITEEKRKKYEKKVNNFISYYANPSSSDYHNMELLRQRIAAFSSRQVYQTHYKNSTTWNVKGFISNYGELRYFLESDMVEAETKKFLLYMIDSAFSTAGINAYFINKNPHSYGNIEDNGYNLYYNMKKNKTMLLVPSIGHSYDALVKLCNRIGISNSASNGNKKSYDALVREYLIKIRVGY